MTLQRIAERIAEKEETEKGIPKDVTMARLMDEPGWREKEIDYLATKTETSPEQVEKLKEEGREGATSGEQEAAGLAYTRSQLVLKEKGLGDISKKAAVVEKPPVVPEAVPEAVPEVSPVATVEVAGKTIPVTQGQLDRLQSADAPEAFKESLALGIVPEGSVYVPGDEGKWSFISQQQADELKESDPRLYRILTEEGEGPYQMAVNAANFTAQQEEKRFRLLHEELPDGQYVLKTELERIKKETPEVWNRLVTEGVDVAQNYIDIFNEGVAKHNAEVEEQTTFLTAGPLYEKGATVDEKVKTVFRILTPWDEEAGETYFQYMSGYPERVKESFLEKFKAPVIPSQEELKAKYDNFQAQPLWLKMLSDPKIIYNKKEDMYIPYLAGEAPLLGGKKQAAEVVAGVVRKVATVGPKEVGMSEKVFAEFLKARARNSNLTPEAFKAARSLQLKAPKTDWQKVIKDLEIAINKNRLRTKPDLVSFGDKTINKSLIKPQVGPAQKLTPEEIVKYRQHLINELEKRGKIAQRNIKRSVRAIEAKGGVRLSPQQQRIADAFRQAREARGVTARAVPVKAPTVKIVPGVSLSPQQVQQVKEVVGVSNKTLQELRALEQTEIQFMTFTQIEALALQQTQLQTKLANEIQEQAEVKAMTATVIANAVQTATSTATQTVTETELKQAINTQVANITDPVTRQQVKTELARITTPALRTEITNITETETPVGIKYPPTEKPPDKTKFPPVEKPPEPGKPRIPLRPRLPANATEKEKRAYIKKSTGAVGWTQGRFHGRPVNHIVTEPYSQATHIVLLGKVPSNVDMKPNVREAYRTITQIRGKGPDEPIKLEGGIADPVIRKRNGKLSISFTPDKPRRSRGPISREISPGIIETRKSSGRSIRRVKLF